MNSTAKFIDWAERGLIPDFLIRMGIRRLCRDRLKRVDQGSPELNRKRLSELVEQFSSGPIAPLPEKANEQHYEVPAKFFELVLGKRKKYSCCYFPTPQSSLDEAEELALKVSCTRAEVKNGHSILELGCGWGSLTLWICEHYPDSKITAVSNSNSQRMHILDCARRQGIDQNLTVITCDMNDFDIEEKFDRVVSIEMFEHMRNYDLLLANVSKWLNDQGKLFVHIFCNREFTYEFQDQGKKDWMSRYFFSGGIMLGEDLFSRFNKDMVVVDRWKWNGTHYFHTSENWLQNLDSNRSEVLNVFENTYGARDAKLWLQRWRMFFLAVSELFNAEEGQQWLVSHYLFAKSQAKDTPVSLAKLHGST